MQSRSRCCRCRFQSTCPRRARRAVPLSLPCPPCFNPRAHEGHDCDLATALASSRVSIHVPTKGTTTLADTEYRRGGVSIHVPTKGTTSFFIKKAKRVKSFNPRAHEGHDLRQIRLRPAVCVSIHVPTKGTTHVTLCLFLHFSVFQSTCPRRARLIGSSLSSSVMEFQSTCPRRARLYWGLTELKPCVFQSTCPRRARRLDDFCDFYSVVVSIHVPTKGTTLYHKGVHSPHKVSIHVPTKGTTL